MRITMRTSASSILGEKRMNVNVKKEEKLREINSPPRLHVWLVKNNGKLFNVGKFPPIFLNFL
jgi:hypothetical protein